MLSIYRVQDRDGRGPFRPGGLSDRWVDEDPRADERPFVNVDFPPAVFTVLYDLARRGYHVGCGFPSLEKLKRWFSSAELSKLYELGFRVVRLTVDEIVAESETQLVFARAVPLNRGADECFNPYGPGPISR